jgi:hypothetical protein
VLGMGRMGWGCPILTLLGWVGTKFAALSSGT